MGKPSYYAIVPANVRYDKDICANSKLLYGEITALCNERGYCWAQNEYFAELYDVSKQTISTWIRQLREKNYITTEIKYKEGTKEILNRYIRIFDDPIKKNTKDNTTYNNTSINILSKDNNNVFEKNKYLESDLFKELITTWNNLPLVNKHKFIESKTMNSLWKLYNKLLSGKFIKSCTNISTGWLIQNNIPVKDKKFSHSEIINIIKQVGLQYQEGYWPWTLEDKKRILPKTLLNVFYNPYNPDCPSVFLKVMANPPRKRNEEEPIDESVLKKYYKLFSSPFYIPDDGDITYAVNCIIREQQKIKNASAKYQTNTKHIINLNDFTNLHIDFLKTFKGLTITGIKPHSGIWKLFINNIQSEYGVDLYPSTEKLKQLIKVHNKEQIRKENIKKLEKTLDTYV
jgi:DNA-binding transcriptional ArsR family regulator